MKKLMLGMTLQVVLIMIILAVESENMSAVSVFAILFLLMFIIYDIGSLLHQRNSLLKEQKALEEKLNKALHDQTGGISFKQDPPTRRP